MAPLRPQPTSLTRRRPQAKQCMHFSKLTDSRDNTASPELTSPELLMPTCSTSAKNKGRPGAAASDRVWRTFRGIPLYGAAPPPPRGVPIYDTSSGKSLSTVQPIQMNIDYNIDDRYRCQPHPGLQRYGGKQHSIYLHGTASGESLSATHPSGSHSLQHILREVTHDGTSSGESLSTVHPPSSHSRLYILHGVTLYGTSSEQSLSTVHPPWSHSLRCILREVTLYCTSSGESLSTVHPPGSHSRLYILQGVTLYGTSSGESLSTVHPPYI